MACQNLISAEELGARLGQTDVRIVDCRFSLVDPGAGRRQYAESHIPAAVYADLDEDLAGPTGPETGRHPLPGPTEFARRLGSWGIDKRTRVVAYDDASGAIASRLWWMLGWIGHRHRSVLDGGFAAWCRAGLPTDPRPASWPEREYGAVVPVGEVLETRHLEQTDAGIIGLVDARDTDRYAGRVEPIDPVAGHIPGALSHPFSRNLDPEGRFLPADELRRRYYRTLSELQGRPVMMCGSGVTACHNILAMVLAGFEEPALYPGSWSEWIRHPSRAVATGE